MVSWQLMDSAALSHIFLMTGHVEPSCQIPLSRGCIHAMPAIAAYDSWNPMSRMSFGHITRCIRRHFQSRPSSLMGLPVTIPISLNVMNSRALVIEADAPVAKVYAVHMPTLSSERTCLEVMEFPHTEVIMSVIEYMIPR